MHFVPDTKESTVTPSSQENSALEMCQQQRSENRDPKSTQGVDDGSMSQDSNDSAKELREIKQELASSRSQETALEMQLIEMKVLLANALTSEDHMKLQIFKLEREVAQLRRGSTAKARVRGFVGESFAENDSEDEIEKETTTTTNEQEKNGDEITGASVITKVQTLTESRCRKRAKNHSACETTTNPSAGTGFSLIRRATTTTNPSAGTRFSLIRRATHSDVAFRPSSGGGSIDCAARRRQMPSCASGIALLLGGKISGVDLSSTASLNMHLNNLSTALSTSCAGNEEWDDSRVVTSRIKSISANPFGFY